VFHRTKGKTFTVASVGHAAYNAEKLIIMNKIVPGAFDNVPIYDKCHGFYRDSQKLHLCNQADKPTLWTKYSDWMFDNCDFPSMAAACKLKQVLNYRLTIQTQITQLLK